MQMTVVPGNEHQSREGSTVNDVMCSVFILIGSQAVNRLRMIVVLLAVSTSVFTDSFRGLAQEESVSAVILEGTCEDVGDRITSLSTLVMPNGERVGNNAALTAANSFTTVPIALGALGASDHVMVITEPKADDAQTGTEPPVAPAVVITTEGTITNETVIDIVANPDFAIPGASEGIESANDDSATDATNASGLNNILACGEIAGVLNEDGALIIGLAPRGAIDISGIAFLSPSPESSQTTISLFITGEMLANKADEVNTETESAGANEPQILPTATTTVQEPVPTVEPQSANGLAVDYLQPAERSGPYAGFAVRFANNTDADIENPQTEVIVELGGEDWTCQGYGDPLSGTAVTGVMDVLGMPLVIPAGEEVPVVIYCRIPETPLDSARLRLR
jgi:hypothetical protein